ncbi:MAG TPA: energy transducer TonB [Candidatus Angelobacter sp.]
MVGWTFLSRDSAISPFELCQEPAGLRWRASLGTSSVLHFLLLAIMVAPVWQPEPVFLKPNLLARGEGGSSTLAAVPLYLPRDLPVELQSRSSLLSLPVPTKQKKQLRAITRHNLLDESKPSGPAEAGSKLGSAIDGPVYGDEVKPALPVSFAEPRISQWELPRDLQGDVIVEVTIDSQGSVVEEKLLQGLGSSIDERVLAAVREWRFRPATRNGVAIASKHDVHFHFPH